MGSGSTTTVPPASQVAWMAVTSSPEVGAEQADMAAGADTSSLQVGGHPAGVDVQIRPRHPDGGARFGADEGDAPSPAAAWAMRSGRVEPAGFTAVQTALARACYRGLLTPAPRIGTQPAMSLSHACPIPRKRRAHPAPAGRGVRRAARPRC